MSEEGILAGKMKELYNSLFHEDWPSWVGGILLAILATMMFAWDRPWGIVAGIRNWGDWLFVSLGVYQKPLESPHINVSSVMDIGFLFGALASALFARSFSLKVPPPLELAKGFVAGILMGVGSSLARGCNVGGFFTSISALSLSGFAMMVGLLFGSYVGLRYLLWELERFPTGMTEASSTERSKERGKNPRAIQPWIGLAIIVGMIYASFRYSDAAYTKTGGILLLALGIGMVMHRSRFCFVAAFRDPFMTGDSRQTRAVALSLMISVIGFGIIKWTGIKEEMVYVTNTFLWGSLLGGFIFGVGMLLAGGCGSGTLWRCAEGQIKLWVVLFSFSLSNAIVRYYMDSTGLIGKLGTVVFLPQILTYRWTIILIILFLFLWYIVSLWNEETGKFTVEV